VVLRILGKSSKPMIADSRAYGVILPPSAGRVDHETLKGIAEGRAERRELLNIEVAGQGRMHPVHRLAELVDGGRVQCDHVSIGLDQANLFGQAGALGFQRLQFLNKTFHGFVTIADRRDDAVDLDHHAVELPFGIVAVDADRLLPFGPPLMIGARQFEQCLTVGKLVLDVVKDGALQGLQAIASAVVAVFPTVRVRASRGASRRRCSGR
jgi:hypothetical protein